MSFKKFTPIALIGIFLLSAVFLMGMNKESNAAKPATTNAYVNVQNIPLLDKDGHEITLANYRGTPVYVKIWASWCPVCLGGLDELEALAAKENKPFNVVTIVEPNLGSEKDPKAFMEWFNKLPYKHVKVLFDTTGQFAKAANLRAMPTSVFLDEDLNIRHVAVGHVPNDAITSVFNSLKQQQKDEPQMQNEKKTKNPRLVPPATLPPTAKTAYLAGGCFWGVEAFFERIPGVLDVVSGYANGPFNNPSYEDLVYRHSGHAETVKITYDSSKVSYATLLKYYFKIIDPTSVNRQGNDVGVQYRTGIFYTSDEQKQIADAAIKAEQQKYNKPIAVEVVPLQNFDKAEEYHQDYLAKHPDGYCHIDLNKAYENVE